MSDETAFSDIRCFVDGELDGEAKVRFDDRLERDQALQQQVRFERALRERVATVMIDAAAKPPGDLRERVHMAWNESAVAGRVDHRGGAAAVSARQPRRSWFAGPERARPLAVAAALIIVAGAVIFGIFGRPIDQQRGVQPNLASEAATYVADEHADCSRNSGHLQQKLLWTDPADAARHVTRHVFELAGTPERVIRVPDLRQCGYEFLGAGKCHIPRTRRSAHMVYRRSPPSDGRAAMASLFIVPNAGQFATFPPGQSSGWTSIDGGPGCGAPVQGMTDGTVVYFLVCCDPNDITMITDRLSSEFGDGVR